MKDIFSSPQKLILNEAGGFIRKEDVHLLLNQFCLDIKYPVTLLCLDENKKIQRIDSEGVGFLLDKACDTFRRLGGYRHCLENDNVHALPYLSHKKGVPKVGYEEYTCKYMGYQEYIFPIEIENSIIAVLFVGQIKIYNDVDIKKIKQDTLAENKDVFEEYIKSNIEKNLISYEDIKERILSNEIDPFLQIGEQKDYDLNWKNYGFYSQKDIDSFISGNVLPNVNKFKEQLVKILTDYRKKYIEKTLNHFENSYNNKHIDFLKKYDSLDEEGQYNISDYWNSFGELFLELKEQLNIKDITYYEQKRETDFCTYEIKISTDYSLIGQEVKFSTDTLDEKRYVVVECSHLKYILKIDFYSSFFSKDLKDYFLGEISKTMKSTLNICAYAMRSKVDSNNNLTTLRIYRHEMDQLILTLGSINYKLSSNYKEELDSVKVEKMHKDFTSSLEAANYITKNIEYFTYSQRGLSNDYGPKVWTNIFNKLNKWRLFVMDESIKRHLTISVPTEEERKNRGDSNLGVYCVEEGLESILYNVINNAIKYCHRGSNIYLDCKTLDIEGSHRQVIIITDYGHGIATERSDDIFKLYYRAVDTNLNIDGSGIGLYLSKLIAKDIDMDISYHCELISKYNLPVLEKYILCKYDTESAPLEDVCKEYNRFEKKELDKIVSPFSKKISDRGVKNDICTPTYKVTFEVII